MTRIINCGEQDIEDDGISISMTFVSEGVESPDDIFINVIDNLLGVSEFVSENGYKFALVGIDFNKGIITKKDVEDFSDFDGFLSKKENKELSELFKKYVTCDFEEPIIEDGTFWYSFELFNTGKSEMSEDDHVKFCKIFKERLK